MSNETTKSKICDLAEELLLSKGFNAFSYKDIATQLEIKNAAVHYHYASKSDLVRAVIKKQFDLFNELMDSKANSSALTRLKTFLSIYTHLYENQQICIVGSLGSDFLTLDENIKSDLTELKDSIISRLSSILEDGLEAEEFHFNGSSRLKAYQITSTFLGLVQVSRISENGIFEEVKQRIIDELVLSHE